MRTTLLAIVALVGLSACTSYLSPKIDEMTGTTLAQRCVDYRMTVASMEAILATRDLTETESAVYKSAVSFVDVYCVAPAAP